MALLRFIRQLPIRPTPEKLRSLMQDYGITRKSCARLMRCSLPALDSYLRPEGARGSRPIPLVRFEVLLLKISAVFHPDEPVNLPL